MKILISILLLLLGLLIYKFKKSLLFIYILAIPVIVIPILIVTFSISSYEESNDLYFYTDRIIGYMCIIILLLEWKFNLWTKKVLIPIIAISIYFIFHNSFAKFDFFIIRENIYNILFTAFPAMILFVNDKFHPKKKELILFINFIISIECIFCILNTFGIYVYPQSKYINFSEHLISGTFPRYNHLTNYLTTIYLFVAIEYFSEKYINKKSFYILTFIIGTIVTFSGSRFSLLIFFTTLGMSYYIFSKKNKLIIIITIVSLVICGLLYLKKGETATISEADQATGLERNILGLSTLVQTDIEESGSTLAMSLYLLTQEFNNPLFGNSYGHLRENAYIFSNWATQETFYADARIAYIIVEFGIVGLLLYIWVYYTIFKCIIQYTKIQYTKKILICVFYLLLGSITEGMLFTNVLTTMIYLYGIVHLNNISHKKV